MACPVACAVCACGAGLKRLSCVVGECTRLGAAILLLSVRLITAASMEELTGMVRQNAENSSQALTLATSATEAAHQGSSAVEGVIATMAEINQSSARIGDIFAIVEGIAFQSNILALNAAVNAARAGEQGRGFAVVASEMRTLAQCSSAAAKEIKDLIGTSSGKVQAEARW